MCVLNERNKVIYAELKWSVRVGDCGNDLSGNGVELVSIMGCLLHRFVVVLSASGILGHSLLPCVIH